MLKSGGSSKKAIRALQAAQDKAIAAQKEGYGYAQNALSPYTGLTKYNPLYEYMSTGVSTPEAQAMMGGNDINAFITNNPAYQYQLAESEKGINRAASARGMWNSSAALNQLGSNSRALAASNWNDYYNRLGNIYNTGMGANNALAGYGMQLGNMQGSTYQNMGSQMAEAIAQREQAKAASKQAMWDNIGKIGGSAIAMIGSGGMSAANPLSASAPSAMSSYSPTLGSNFNYGNFSLTR